MAKPIPKPMSNDGEEKEPAEIRVTYSSGLKMSERPMVSSSMSAYEMVKRYFDGTMEAHESFVVLLVDRGNRLKGVYRHSTGGLHGTVADPKLVFAVALKTLSSAMILVHNHPSGQLRPSEEDIRLTKKFVEAGKFLDLPVNDHLIVTAEGYYSFADQGMI